MLPAVGGLSIPGACVWTLTVWAWPYWRPTGAVPIRPQRQWAENLLKTRLLPRDYFDIAGKAGYFPALDGLRAIAITMVLVRHWAAACRDHFHVHFILGNRLLSNICLNGWSGVDLFFALSGFLVGSHVLRQTHARLDEKVIRRYYLRRFLRIVPLYVLILLLCGFGLIPLYAVGGMDAFQFLVQMLFLQDYLGSPVLLPSWSLGVEEKFYLLAPFLAFFLLKLEKRMAIRLLWGLSAVPVVVGLLVMRYWWQPDSYGSFFWALRTPFHFAVAAILMGMAVALMKRDGLYTRFFHEHGRAVLYTSFALIIVVFAWRDWFSPYEDVTTQDWMATLLIIFLLSVLYATLVLCGVADNRLSRGWLGSRPLRFVSKTSYALYLAHYAVIPLSLWLTDALLTALHLRGQVASCALLMPVFFGASLLLALAMHLTVEKPFLLLRDRIRH